MMPFKINSLRLSNNQANQVIPKYEFFASNNNFGNPMSSPRSNPETSNSTINKTIRKKKEDDKTSNRKKIIMLSCTLLSLAGLAGKKYYHLKMKNININ